MIRIREATEEDLEEIMEILQDGKRLMHSSGNMSQWPGAYPTRETILLDLSKKAGYVAVDGSGRPECYFAFIPGPDSTYARIYDGKWRDEGSDYHVLHRVARRIHAGGRGIGKAVIGFCLSHAHSLRVDTHEDNAVMRHLLEETGFSYQGQIICQDGTPRLAFQKDGLKD